MDDKDPGKNRKTMEDGNESGRIPPFLPKGEESNIPKKFHPKEDDRNRSPDGK